MSCPQKNTEVIKKALPEFKANGKTQKIGDTSFICVGDYWKTAHHYGEMSWMDEEHKQLAKYAKRINVPQKVRDKLWSPRIFGFFDKFKLKPVKKLYTFLVYDFIDYGPRYFLARVWQKIKRKLASDKK